jgi:hypothetical protein
MEYFKTRWSSDKAQSQAIEANYNTVAFNNNNVNQAPNPIIISTHRGHPSQISIIHEVRNPSVKTMTSPTDSFHSVVSNMNEKKEGNVNIRRTSECLCEREITT